LEWACSAYHFLQHVRNADWRRPVPGGRDRHTAVAILPNGFIWDLSIAFWKKFLSITTQACILEWISGSVSAMAPTDN
jgi:hypothetical protein